MSDELNIQNNENKEIEKKENDISASIAILPEGVAITAIKSIKYDPYASTRVDTCDLFKEIQKQELEIKKGNLVYIERYLYSQAIALNALFDRMLNQLAHADFTPQVQLSGMLALKAQAQCRATLATLAQIKNPDQITYIEQNIQQQNNAINQQVNPPTIDDSKKSEKIANELLREVKHETLEFRGTEKTIRINPAMETVEAINGGKISKRERY
jgi:hypothetical protein